MSKKMSHLLLAAALSVLCAPAANADEKIRFPATLDGRQVLAVDFHVHTIWSDALVWPTVRIEEAQREGLDAIALTEHVEFTRFQDDLHKTKGFVDKNRPYELAKARASKDLVVVHGAEITRGVGHYNCLFITDANALRVKGARDAVVYADLDARFQSKDPAVAEGAEASLAEAKKQGGFCFWNHPHWPGQPAQIAQVLPFHRKMIDTGKIGGLEVAGGQGLFVEAIDIALENNLAILANSDTHRPIGTELENTGLPHRTVTLLLAKDKSAASIRAALDQRKSIGLYRNTLIGSQDNVSDIVQAALTIRQVPNPKAADFPSNSMSLILKNNATIPLVLSPLDGRNFLNATDIVKVPAKGETTVWVTRVDPPQPDALRFEVINSYAGSSTKAKVTLPIQR